MKQLILFVFVIAGCSSLQKADQLGEPFALNSIENFYPQIHAELEAECASTPVRDPASEQCRRVFANAFTGSPVISTGESGLTRTVRRDRDLRADLAMPSARQVENTVELAPRMRRFRERFLSYFSPAYSGREALVRSFESSLRLRSTIVTEVLKENPAAREYDYVIIGSGVHGIISLHKILKEQPNAKILILDEGDTAGATFRYGKDFFNINSSNRESGRNSVPLPGQGNLNELPGLPIQVSDMTAVKYPSANDLGSALVTGLYSAVLEHPNVDVVFNSRANRINTREGVDTVLDVRIDGSPEAVQIKGQAVVVTTGLGRPRVPEKVARTLRQNPELQTSRDPRKLPRVVNFEDLVRIVSRSNDPKALFAGKRFAVVGDGDSANVVLDYALGLASREAYASSSAQAGRPEKIIWIGQKARTCREFINQARSRYAAIGKGFDTSDPQFEALLTSEPSKLSNVSQRRDGRIDATLESSEKVEDLDFVILTAGSTRNVRELFNSESRFSNDDAFLQSNNFFPLTAQTSVSRNMRTKVGFQSSDGKVVVLGPAAGDLTVEAERVGVIQNSVSIFNNAPRVVSGTELIVQQVQPRARLNTYNLVRVEARDTQPSQTVRITEVEEARVIPGQTLGLVKSILQETLLYFRNVPNRNLDLTLVQDANGDIIVRSATNIEISPVLETLANTREFFSLARELLRNSPGKALRIEAPSASNRFRAAQATIRLVSARGDQGQTGEVYQIANRRIPLRGIVEVEQSTATARRGNNGRGSGQARLDLVPPQTTTARSPRESFKFTQVTERGAEFRFGPTRVKIFAENAEVGRENVFFNLPLPVSRVRVLGSYIEVTTTNGTAYEGRLPTINPLERINQSFEQQNDNSYEFVDGARRYTIDTSQAGYVSVNGTRATFSLDTYAVGVRQKASDQFDIITETGQVLELSIVDGQPVFTRNSDEVAETQPPEQVLRQTRPRQRSATTFVDRPILGSFTRVTESGFVITSSQGKIFSFFPNSYAIGRARARDYSPNRINAEAVRLTGDYVEILAEGGKVYEAVLPASEVALAVRGAFVSRGDRKEYVIDGILGRGEVKVELVNEPGKIMIDGRLENLAVNEQVVGARLNVTQNVVEILTETGKRYYVSFPDGNNRITPVSAGSQRGPRRRGSGDTQTGATVTPSGLPEFTTISGDGLKFQTPSGELQIFPNLIFFKDFRIEGSFVQARVVGSYVELINRNGESYVIRLPGLNPTLESNPFVSSTLVKRYDVLGAGDQASNLTLDPDVPGYFKYNNVSVQLPTSELIVGARTTTDSGVQVLTTSGRIFNINDNGGTAIVREVFP